MTLTIAQRFNLPTTMFLGDKVRDKLTGYTGIIHTFMTSLDGNVRAGVVPRVVQGLEDKYPEGMDLDVCGLEVIEASTVQQVPFKETDINLGDKVRHIITGYKGYATVAHFSFSGCVNFFVQAPLKKKKKTATTDVDGGFHFIACDKLILVEEDPLDLRNYDMLPAEETPGGPPTKMSRALPR